jgi:hypothetical protein
MKFQGQDGFLGTTFSGVPFSPSLVRIYVAPTLTAQVGVAICFMPYKAAQTTFPRPIGAIAGNCIVTALKPQCKQEKSQAQLDTPEETFLPRTKDLSQNCIQERKGEVARQAGYASTPFNTIFGKMEIENAVYPIKPSKPSITRRSRFNEMMKTHNIPEDKRGQIATILLDYSIQDKAMALAGLLGGSTNIDDYSRSTGSPENMYPTTLPDTNIMGIVNIEGAPQSTLTIGEKRIAPGDLTKNKVTA